RPPFTGDDLVEVLRRVVEEEPARPRAVRPGVPRDLETICLKCLRKEPAQRYASAQEVAEDLERWLAGRPIRARRVGLAERFGKWLGRQGAAAGLGLIAATASLAAVAAVAGAGALAVMTLLCGGWLIVLLYFLRQHSLRLDATEPPEPTDRPGDHP